MKKKENFKFRYVCVCVCVYKKWKNSIDVPRNMLFNKSLCTEML